MGSGADLVIPQHLRPEDGRFGCGPSKVPAAAVRALAEAGPTLLGTSHRQAPVKALVHRLRAGLAEFFQAPAGYEVVLGNGGATYFWDVATLSLIERRSQHLVFGEFSSKFAQAVYEAPHLDEPEIIESPPGTLPTPIGNTKVDTYCLTQNETSTGVAMPVERVGSPGQLVLVDATSAAGGMRVDLGQTDVYYFSPQKCFASDGGLWVALLSPTAISRTERLCRSDRWIPPSLNLLTALTNSRQDQTYNTPAVATLFLFAQQLDWLLAQGGLEWAADRCQQSAGIVYDWAAGSDFATPYVADPAQRSPVVATVDLDPSVSAQDVSAALRRNGIVDTDAYRKLGRNQLRLGLFPAVDPADVRQLTLAIDWVAARLRDRDAV
ncbi:MAG TPA: phosphoserine transaminase [Candidatus Nanopelagicaceae bacterium]|nr:phosphoserine transaminase [Candidatus Nanopelagicaceae bacterium]